jgi:hypothetical protein
MPCTYHIDTHRGVIFVGAWGVLTEPEIVSAGRAIRADPGMNARYTRLENLMEVTETPGEYQVRPCSGAGTGEGVAPPPGLRGRDGRGVRRAADGGILRRCYRERFPGVPWPVQASPTTMGPTESSRPSPQRWSD